MFLSLGEQSLSLHMNSHLLNVCTHFKKCPWRSTVFYAHNNKPAFFSTNISIMLAVVMLKSIIPFTFHSFSVHTHIPSWQEPRHGGNRRSHTSLQSFILHLIYVGNKTSVLEPQVTLLYYIRIFEQSLLQLQNRSNGPRRQYHFFSILFMAILSIIERPPTCVLRIKS